MKSTPALKKIPAPLDRQIARRAVANHRTVEGDILYRLERSVAQDDEEEKLAAHLRRALSARQVPVNPDDVMTWAGETFDQLERPARQK